MVHTQEQNKKNSDSHKGQIPWNKGIPMKEEQKQNLSKLKKDKTYEDRYGKEKAAQIKEQQREKALLQWKRRKEKENSYGSS